METDSTVLFLAELYIFVVLFGFLTNALIIAATVSFNSLHSTCNILIAFCSLSDILHLSGQIPKIIWIFSGSFYMSSYLCNALQAIPLFGLNAGTILILSIGVDRLISVLLPTYYTSKNSTSYLAIHVLVIVAYYAAQCGMIVINFEEKSVICSPPEAYHGRAKEDWATVSCLVYIAAFVVYFFVWMQVRRKGGPNLRVFRSIFTVMIVVALGWFTAMAGFLIVRLTTTLEGRDLYVAEELLGIPVNSSLCANYFVYYYLSADYRAAFRSQLRKTPVIGNRFIENTRTITVTRSITSVA